MGFSINNSNNHLTPLSSLTSTQKVNASQGKPLSSEPPSLVNQLPKTSGIEKAVPNNTIPYTEQNILVQIAAAASLANKGN